MMKFKTFSTIGGPLVDVYVDEKCIVDYKLGSYIKHLESYVIILYTTNNKVQILSSSIEDFEKRISMKKSSFIPVTEFLSLSCDERYVANRNILKSNIQSYEACIEGTRITFLNGEIIIVKENSSHFEDNLDDSNNNNVVNNWSISGDNNIQNTGPNNIQNPAYKKNRFINLIYHVCSAIKGLFCT